MDGQRQIGVLGDRFARKHPGLDNGLGTPGANGTRHDKDPVKGFKGPAVDVLADQIFKVLAGGQPVVGIPNLDDTGNRPDRTPLIQNDRPEEHPQGDHSNSRNHPPQVDHVYGMDLAPFTQPNLTRPLAFY